MLLSPRRRAPTHDHSLASAVGALCGVHTSVALSSAAENSGNLYPEFIYFTLPTWSSNNSVELLVLRNTAVEFHILQDRHFSPFVIECRHTHNLHWISYIQQDYSCHTLCFCFLGGIAPVVFCTTVQPYGYELAFLSGAGSWPIFRCSHYNVIGTSIDERVVRMLWYIWHEIMVYFKTVGLSSYQYRYCRLILSQ